MKTQNSIHKILLAALLWLALSQGAVAQGNNPNNLYMPNVTPPTPDAAALGKYGDIPISNYTGTASFSIPLYELKGRSISLPISLSYHGSAVNIADISPWTGTGWTLNAGGVITRTIRGVSDFSSMGLVKSNTRLPQAFYIDCRDDAGVDGTTTTNTGNGYLNEVIKSRQRDTQPDLFYFNFGEYSGKFFFDEEKKLHYDGPHKLQIVPPTDDRGEWRITTPDGYEYVFGLDSDTNGDGRAEQYVEWVKNMNAVIQAVDLEKQASAWYLKQVRSPLGEKIKFKYKPYVLDYFSPYSEDWYTLTPFIGNQGPCSSHFRTSHGDRFVSTALHLDEISLEYEGRTIIVRVEVGNNRTDLAGTKRLDGLAVSEVNLQTGGQKLLKKFLLSYHSNRRLWLTRVQEVQVDENNAEVKLPPYQLEYNAYDKLPGRSSYALDHWGFFNGKTRNNTLLAKTAYDFRGEQVKTFTEGADRDPNATTMVYGMLKRITYPTGGYTDLEFEPHQYRPHTYEGGGFNAEKRTLLAVCQGHPENGPDLECDNSAPAQRTFIIESQTATLTATVLAAEYVANTVEACQGTGTASCSSGLSQQSFTLNEPKKVRLTYQIDFTNGTPIYYYVRLSGSTGYSESFYPETGGSGQGATTVERMLAAGTYTLVASVYGAGNPGSSQAAARAYGRVDVINKANPSYNVALIYPDGHREVFAQTITLTKALPTGTYRMEVYASDVLYPGAKASLQLALSTNATLDNIGGGVRIKTVRHHDGLDVSRDKIQVYKYHQLNAPTRTSGLLMAPVNYLYNAIVPTFGTVLGDVRCSYDMRAAYSSTTLGSSASGSHVGYDNVTIEHSDGGQGGISTYVYTNKADGINFRGIANNLGGASGNGVSSSFSAADIDMPEVLNTSYAHENGHLLEATDYAYSRAGAPPKPVKKVIHTYEAYDEGMGRGLLVSSPIVAERDVAGSAALISGNGLYPCRYLTYKNYYLPTSRYRISRTREMLYGHDGAQPIETTTAYYYENPQHEQLTRKVVTLTGNRQQIYKYKYPHDYQASTATGIAELLRKNQINTVVEEQRWEQSSGPARLVAGTVKQYGTMQGQVVLQAVHTLEAAKPVTDLVENKVGSLYTELIPDARYYKRQVQYTDYDAYGNVRSVAKERDVPTTYLWGYNATAPVAEVKNATYADVVAVLGQGVIDQLARAYPGTDAEVQQLLRPLRTQLKTAQVTTYTHRPLVGVTSRTDPSGRTATYEYDAFHRLVRVKDESNRILSQHEYQYARP